MRNQRKVLRECMRRAMAKTRPVDAPRARKFHYCFIVQEGKILAMGVNRDGPGLLEKGYADYQVIHAENDAYTKAKGLLDHSRPFQAVNVRITRKDEVRISAPCPCCRQFLDTLGCCEVFFTTDEGNFARMV